MEKKQMAVEWMMESKKTPIDWMIDKLIFAGIKDLDLCDDILLTAKQMQKELTIYAVNKENIRCTNIANDTINILYPASGKIFRPDEKIGEITYMQMFEIFEQ